MGLVIGITGRNCAGKDTVAEILERHGFERHSLSDVLRVELERRGVAITRPALIALGRELRRQEGPAVLARRVQALMRTDRAALVSVRSPAEVAVLREELPRFVLWNVEAPQRMRFEREQRRGRESAPGTLEAFAALEDRENTSDPHAQQLDATRALADDVLANDGTLAELDARVRTLLESLHERA